MKSATLVMLLGLASLLGTPAIAHPGFDPEQLDRLFDALEANNRMMGSLTLSRHGKVIYDRTIGFRDISDDRKIPSDAQTIFRIGSITKIYTAVMIWQLIEEGKLSLDTPLARFFPNIPNADTITVAHLLSHTSGLHDYTSDLAHDDPQSWAFRPQSSARMVARIAASNPDFTPGEKSRYSNTNYTLLGYIVEAVTASTYGQQLDARIVAKLGLERTRYDGNIAPENNEAHSYVYEDGTWNLSHEEALSVAAGAGGIVSTPAEMTTFITALGNHTLIGEDSLQKMTAAFSEEFPDSHKGIALFTLRGIDKQAISKQGGIDAFTSNIAYVPDDGFALALTINGNNYPMAKIFWSVMDIYYGRPVYIPTFRKLDLPAETLLQYTGIFALAGSGMKISISTDGDSLSAQASGQDAFSVEPIDPSTFSNAPSGILMEFGKDANGVVSNFTLHQGRNTSRWEKQAQ